jgi:hypothetical protein
LEIVERSYVHCRCGFLQQEVRAETGDQGYRTPEFLKAWAMRESGGEGDERAFRTDPFQVNNPGDWAPEKIRMGLRKGQRMTPAISAFAALESLRQKSQITTQAARSCVF